MRTLRTARRIAIAVHPVAELDDLGDFGLLMDELFQRGIESQQLVAVVLVGNVELIEIEPLAPAAVAEPLAAAGAFDEDAAHGLGGGREEMPAAVPVLRLLDIDESQIRFVNQRGGL